MTLNEDKLINDYQNGHGIYDLCSKYKIGKDKLKKILCKNGVSIRKKGRMQQYKYKIKNASIPKYIPNKNKTYIAISKYDGQVINDYMNKSGALTKYIKDVYNVNPPSERKRKTFYKINGKYRYEDYFIIKPIEKVKKEILKCPYCDWQTIDKNNIRGRLTIHLLNKHNIGITELLEDYPEYINHLSKEQKISEFLSNEENFVTCAICGKKLKRIDNAHLSSHNLTQEEYIKLYNAPTLSKSTHDKISENIIQFIINNPNVSYSSKGETEISDFISSYGFNVEKNTCNLIGKEIDIYIPDKKIAIEYNGLYWHSETFKDKNYHLRKTMDCENQNIKLIHIFEDEWQNKQDICKSRILNILGLTENRIYARKCVIKQVDNKTSTKFLNDNHIQGNCISKYAFGLYFNDELVSLMSFSSLRKSLGYKSSKGVFELIRFCNKLNTTVIGGANKLLKHFIKTIHPIKIISYADRRWSNGNLYEKLNFNFVKNTSPNYFYVMKHKRVHRFNFRKSKLIEMGMDKNKTEHQIMLEHKIPRIYDCGNKLYEMIISQD